MSKQTIVEIECDNCGCADHYSPGYVNAMARENGWIITRDGKHYCKQECRKQDRANQARGVIYAGQ